MRQRTVGPGASLVVIGTGFDVTLNHVTDRARLLIASALGAPTSYEVGRTIYVEPDVDGVTLQVESTTGQDMSPSAKAFITLAPVGGRERILLTDLDVGGHRVVEVASLRAVGDGKSELSTIGGANVETPPLVRQAQLSAAGALGLRGNKLRSRQSIDIAIVIDGTASMRTWLREGALTAVAQCISGVDLVVGHDEKLDLRVAGSRDPWRSVAAMEVSQEIERQFASIGQISRVELYEPIPSGGQAWCVVTDHAPDVIPETVALIIVLCGPGADRVISAVSGDPRVFCLEVDPFRPASVPALDEASVHRLVSATLMAYRLETEGEQP
ncbi:hypothetical protein [Tessaracoccus flavus]|uniref:hypothetical protein n=1 Tax=Tessaracoccus flavus TaxID=1610493 RepID=UPI000894AEF8|nr:hypothetical protein [Tessaracoccus flavus]SDY92054.1 hypothetical protein SAMN05428934_10664 [Tessaracoccus flavus]